MIDARESPGQGITKFKTEFLRWRVLCFPPFAYDWLTTVVATQTMFGSDVSQYHYDEWESGANLPSPRSLE